MKYHEDDNYEKNRKKEWNREHTAGGFRCSHCKRWVSINDFMGTKNRNHCNMCLWSKHVDINKGDRRSDCKSGMKPVGLTFKHEGYGRQGEIMLVHRCAWCEEVSINRLAADDNDEQILVCFEESLTIPHEEYSTPGITLLERSDLIEVRRQLFGK